MENVAFIFEADLDFDETYETDLTPYLNSIGQGFRVSRGFDPDGQYQTSTVTLGLDNTAGTFSPGNMASPLYGRLMPDVPVRVRAVRASVSYTLWTGYVREWGMPGGDIGRERCDVFCHDMAGLLRDSEPISLLVDERTTGEAMLAIAAELGLDSSDYVFDAGEQTLPVHYARQQDARDAANQVVMSEMGGRDFINADGQWVFEDRHHRLGLEVQHTWGDGTPIRPVRVTPRFTTSERVSQVSVQASVYTEGQADEPIFLFSRGMHNKPADSIEIAGGGQYGPVEVNWDDLAYAITSPAPIVDYLANTAIDGSGTDRTDDLEVEVTNAGAGGTLTIRNTHGSAVFVTKLQLRGQPATFAGQQPVFSAALSVPGMKLGRGVALGVPFADDGPAARDYSVATLRTYRYPYPRVTLEFPWANDETVLSMLAVELGDLVWWEDVALGTRASGLADWWYVEGIAHERRVSGNSAPWPMSTITLVPSYLYRNLDRVAFDSFNRDDGALGESSSGHTWADDTDFSIDGGAAVPDDTGLKVPSLVL